MHCTWPCLKTIVFPLNSTKNSPTVQYFFRACDIWQQFKVVREPWEVHVHTNFRFDEDRVVLLPESSLPLLRVGVLVVYQIENYFSNIELFYFLKFMAVVEMVRMFEDLLISYLYRQKLSSQDGYHMRKIH